MRVTPKEGPPKRGGPEASASLASPQTHHCVAHPGLSDRTNRGVKFTQPWNSTDQLPEQFAQMFLRIREQSSTYIFGLEST